MRKRKARQRRQADVQRVALQRTLAYLEVLRPGVPMPVIFIENLVSGDLILEGPNAPVLQKLAEAPEIIHVGLNQLYHLTIQDSGCEAITVSEAQRETLRALIRELGPETPG
jgi:hypothetical protein